MASATTSKLVPELFREYGEITRIALNKYLPSREPRRYLYDLLADYPQRASKMMRPSLCIATARAFGAGIEDAIGSAVSIELLHNALLVHDDIQDESEERRGRPTLHALHGVPLAINAGDTLTLLSLRPLMENRGAIGARLAIRIIEETERMALASAEGQAMELGWRRDNVLELEVADYLEMVLKKTCWLATIHPSRVGALIGTRGAIDLEPFIRFGFFIGAAFQIQDDLLNLIGDERSYGKEIDGDIWEGKRSLMLLHLLHEASREERDQVSAMMRQPRNERSDRQVRWVRGLMDRYGCVEHARQIALGLSGAALHEYSLIYSDLPPSRDKRFIEELATWVVERT
jgi:geranylgeranyl diphosphate synthase, type II